MAVSDDLRERVVEAVVLGGLSRNRAASRLKSLRSERRALGEAVQHHGRDFAGGFWRRPPLRPDQVA